MISMVEIPGKSSDLIHGKHVSASAHVKLIFLIYKLLWFFSLLIFILLSISIIPKTVLEKQDVLGDYGLHHTTSMLYSLCEMVH